jgi:hypothetical protein
MGTVLVTVMVDLLWQICLTRGCPSFLGSRLSVNRYNSILFLFATYLLSMSLSS